MLAALFFPAVAAYACTFLITLLYCSGFMPADLYCYCHLFSHSSHHFSLLFYNEDCVQLLTLLFSRADYVPCLKPCFSPSTPATLQRPGLFLPFFLSPSQYLKESTLSSFHFSLQLICFFYQSFIPLSQFLLFNFFTFSNSSCFC